MTSVQRSLASAFGILMAVGCAHAPAERAALQDAKPQTAIITGSRIPQRTEASSGLPATFSPVRIYTRQQLNDTGRQYDTGSALNDLDPSLVQTVQPIRK